MLALYVSVLEALVSGGGAGEEMTIGKVARECGVTYHKAKKALEDLEEFGMAFRHMKLHRPNVVKSYFDASLVGSSWVRLMKLNRMKGS